MIIDVRRKSAEDNLFIVIISDNNSTSKHHVVFNEKLYARITKEAISKEKFIKISFEFLLQREPKESILKKFNINIISSYFPEYEKQIMSHISITEL